MQEHILRFNHKKQKCVYKGLNYANVLLLLKLEKTEKTLTILYKPY